MGSRSGYALIPSLIIPVFDIICTVFEYDTKVFLKSILTKVIKRQIAGFKFKSRTVLWQELRLSEC